jgi:transposase InsO family protein
MATLNSEAFKDLPPSQIVPRLADTGVYVASESTMYRLLRQEGQLTHRRSERAAQMRSRPRALTATGPDQVFCWDITYLPTQVRGQHFYVYLFEDLFSPQDRGLAGVRLRECRVGRPVAARHLCAAQHPPGPADGAFGQWRADEGRDHARHHAAPGRGPHAQSAIREQ